MLFLSVGIMFFTKYYMPDILNALPVQEPEYLFYLKFTMIGTILCVGLVCPFVCPLLKYNMVYIRACFKSLRVIILKWRKENDLQIELMNLAQKIKV